MYSHFSSHISTGRIVRDHTNRWFGREEHILSAVYLSRILGPRVDISSRRINKMNFVASFVVVVVVVGPQIFCSNDEMCLNIDVSQLAKSNNISYICLYIEYDMTIS